MSGLQSATQTKMCADRANHTTDPDNPSDDHKVNISLPKLEEGTYTLTVLDLSGMTIFSETREYGIGGEQTFSVGTSDYTSGIYFVTLSQGDLTKTKKIVIAK